MAITDKYGEIIEENKQLSLVNLYGFRILSTPNSGTILIVIVFSDGWVNGFCSPIPLNLTYVIEGNQKSVVLSGEVK